MLGLLNSLQLELEMRDRCLKHGAPVADARMLGLGLLRLRQRALLLRELALEPLQRDVCGSELRA